MRLVLRSSSSSSTRTVALLAATTVALGGLIAAPGTAQSSSDHPGLREVAVVDGFPLFGAPSFTPDEQQAVFAADLGDGVQHPWIVDLSDPDSAPRRLGPDLSQTDQTVLQAIAIGNRVVYRRQHTVEQGIQILSIPADGSGAPESVYVGFADTDRQVTAFGPVGAESVWWRQKSAPGPATPQVLYARRADLSEPLRRLSPPEYAVTTTLPLPDGSHVAWIGRDEPGPHQLWITATTDSFDQARLLLDPAALPATTRLVSAVVSPDSTRVLAITLRDNVVWDWWSIPVTGSFADAVSLDTWTAPMNSQALADFSPDGTQVRMTRIPPDDPQVIRRAAADGSGAGVTVAMPSDFNQLFAADWTPDNRVVFIAARIDPFVQHAFVEASPGEPVVDLGPHASGDVQFDAAARLVTLEGDMIELVPTDGSARRQISFDTEGSRAGFRSVTPDGTWAMVATFTPSGPLEAEGLVLVPLTGSGGAVPRMGVDRLATADDLWFYSLAPQGGWAVLSHGRDTDGDSGTDDGPLSITPFPPAVPRQVEAIADNGEIRVTWTAPIGTRPVTGYVVTAFPYEPDIAPSAEYVDGSARSATVTGLANGVFYDVRIAASNLGGAGPHTDQQRLLPLAEGVIRISGDDRTSTAAAVSEATFRQGVQVAYVATASGFPDALGAGPAAARDGGPILLTSPTSLSEPTRTELERLRPGRIVVLGGPAAVADEVVAELGSLTEGTVRRLAGANRYATSAAISATFEEADTVYLATGANFPDALAGAALAAQGPSPVLLTTPDQLPPEVEAELARLSPDTVVVLGGPTAVSDAVVGQATLLAGAVERIFGPDRYATSAAIAEAFPAPTDVVHIATGVNFPDALAGTPAAAAVEGPVVLVGQTELTPPAIDALQRLQPRRIVILGGTTAVPKAFESDLVKFLR